jgi:hypothetical protein
VTGQALPAGNDLDNITRGHPAIFRRGDGHIAVANSAAFALSGVSSKPNGCAGRVFKEMASHLRYRGNVTGGWRRETSLCRQSFVPIFLVLHDRRVGLHLVLVKNALRAISSLLFKLLRMTLAFLCLEVIYCRQWKRIPLAGWKSGALLLTLAVQAVLATAFAFTIQRVGSSKFWRLCVSDIVRRADGGASSVMPSSATDNVRAASNKCCRVINRYNRPRPSHELLAILGKDTVTAWQQG